MLDIAIVKQVLRQIVEEASFFNYSLSCSGLFKEPPKYEPNLIDFSNIDIKLRLHDFYIEDDYYKLIFENANSPHFSVCQINLLQGALRPIQIRVNIESATKAFPMIMLCFIYFTISDPHPPHRTCLSHFLSFRYKLSPDAINTFIVKLDTIRQQNYRYFDIEFWKDNRRFFL
jgi:hypothetical protein